MLLKLVAWSHLTKEMVRIKQQINLQLVDIRSLPTNRKIALKNTAVT